ncbi:hypothetical protein SAMN05661080_04555 [Modestobacter sp. DSM 44400]|uniref:hypothetical protein n=1 Tax=Modestobacter sp. DSM 44400 TaxID=1550230 RepID=UPI000896DDDD|nr:hypothetical protein [Modestobacter sp. DSM 44400]SDY77202.1 hypothetical protein SAMN05661080_04555 [Modestobacter sp. DSM 44400]
MTSPAPDWADEARRFLAGSGLADALAAMGSRTDSPAAPASGDGAGQPAECRWCPLCVGLAALRGRRPDLLEGLADLLTTAATVVRAQAAAAGPAPAEPAAEDEPVAGDDEPAPAPVQRIEVA